MSRVKHSAVAALALGVMAAGCGSESSPPEACAPGPGIACNWAGTGTHGFNGDGLTLLESELMYPFDVEFAPDGTPWIIDFNNHRVRRVTADGTLETMMGNDELGDGDAEKKDITPGGAVGTAVKLNHPSDIDFAADGKVIVACWHNHKIRVIDPATDNVIVLGGRGAGFAGDGDKVGKALFIQPSAVARAADGTIYIADQGNQRVRRVAPDGTITTVVGTPGGGPGTPGYSGDGGVPEQAEIFFQPPGNEPSGAVAVDSAGDLYIADSKNHRIRKVDFAANVITTVAGTGEPGYSGDGGPATAAQLNDPRDIEIGPDGRLYICDTENGRVRAVDLATGTIELVAGNGTRGMNQGVPAKDLMLNRPFGISFDADGNLYIADTYNSRIVKVSK